jgi:mRNA-degrading endonuclease RelE of RelBE toxin-antitoxin system
VYNVFLTKRAQKEYEELPSAALAKVDAFLDRLKTETRPRGVKKLQGNIHRIRIGDWRIIYTIFDKDRLVLIGKIIRRSEDTYDGVKDLF